MFDPFKRARVRAAKKIRRSVASTVTDTWGNLLGPAKSVKRTKSKTEKKANTSSVTTRNRKSGAAPVKSKTPATSRSRSTVPRGASFQSGTNDCAFGTRTFKLYLPVVAGKNSGPLPLVVMLHGCGQTPQDFARGTGMNALAEEFGFIVLYPAQARKAHLNRCWNWFRRGDQMRGAGEPALIASLTRTVIAEHNVDPARVYVAGLSAGAAAAMIVATAYHDIFAVVGVHSGMAAGAAHDAGSATRAMQGGDPGKRQEIPTPTIIFHGDADKVVNPRNGRFVTMRGVEPFAGLSKNEQTRSGANGRGYTRIQYRIGKGRPYVEQWVVHESGHAWSGGHVAGSYTDPKGPDASREMVRFFMRHRTTKKRRATLPQTG